MLTLPLTVTFPVSASLTETIDEENFQGPLPTLLSHNWRGKGADLATMLEAAITPICVLAKIDMMGAGRMQELATWLNEHGVPTNSSWDMKSTHALVHVPEAATLLTRISTFNMPRDIDEKLVIGLGKRRFGGHYRRRIKDPTILAVILHTGYELTDDEKDVVNHHLAPLGLRLEMTCDELFAHRQPCVPLTHASERFLLGRVTKDNFSEEFVTWAHSYRKDVRVFEAWAMIRFMDPELPRCQEMQRELATFDIHLGEFLPDDVVGWLMTNMT